MSKQAAKFIGDLAWFSASKTKGRYSSPREALKAHLDYITRPSECALAYNLDKAEWLRRADMLLERSTRSRVAAKQVYALPNDLSPSEGLNLLKEFLTSREIFFVKQREGGKTRRIPVRLSSEDLGIAIHDSKGISGVRNLHAHVLFSPVHKRGKLDANKKSLSRLHKEWEEFLKSKGYSLRQSPIKEPHYGPSRLRIDSRARASYAHLTRGKQLWREALEREQLRRVMEQAVKTRGGDNLLSWDEIQKNEENIGVATRRREKAERVVRQSPPPRPSHPVKPVKQVKPVQQSKPVVNPQQPRSVQQPRVRVDLQRPSQVQSEEEVASKDPVKQIRKQVEKELAEKKRKERQLANEINYSLKQQARINSPPPGRPASYPKQKERMEVGNVNTNNPFITQEVIEERKEEIQRKEQETQIRQAEMEITYLYRFKDSQNTYRGTLTVKFRTLASWNREQTKTVAAFLATIVVARLYGFEYPEDSLSFYGKFVYREAVQVEEGIKEYMSKKGIKSLYSSQDEALRALSVKRAIFVRVRIYENGKLVEQFSFYLTKESFTIMERYAEAVRRRRPQPPQPGGQPPQQPQPGYQDDEDEDYDRAPGM